MRVVNVLVPILLALALAACGAEQAATATDTAAATGAAQSAAPDPARFELDMAGVDRWIDATRRLSALTKQDASLKEVVSAHSGEPREEFIARLQGNAAVAAAIEDAGLSPTEYALTTETLVGALLAIGMLDAGAIQELPPAIRDTQPVAFVQANKAEITAKMVALKRGGASAE